MGPTHTHQHGRRRACAGVTCKFALLSFRVPGPGSPSQTRPGVEKHGQGSPDGTEVTREVSGRRPATLLSPGLQDTRCSPPEPADTAPALKDRKEGLSQVRPRGWASGAGTVTLSSGPVGPIPPQSKQPRGRDRVPEGGPLPPPPGLRCAPAPSRPRSLSSLQKASPYPRPHEVEVLSPVSAVPPSLVGGCRGGGSLPRVSLGTSWSPNRWVWLPGYHAGQSRSLSH